MSYAEEGYKQEIKDKLASMPMKDKLEKIPWETFRENLNIPEEILQRQLRGVEKEMQQARERYEEESVSESDALSYHTDPIFDSSESEESVEAEKQEDELESEEIDKFILNDEDFEIGQGRGGHHDGGRVMFGRRIGLGRGVNIHRKRKARPRAHRAGDGDVATHHTGKLAANRQAQACATDGAHAVCLATHKRAE